MAETTAADNSTDTEDSESKARYCARCGATVYGAAEGHDHVKDEHDNQPTQMLDTLDPDEVVHDATAEMDDLIENWDDLDQRGKEGKLIVIREILDGYETVKELQGEA